MLLGHHGTRFQYSYRNYVPSYRINKGHIAPLRNVCMRLFPEMHHAIATEIREQTTREEHIATKEAPSILIEDNKEWYYSDFLMALKNKEISEVIVKKDLSSLYALSKFGTRGYVELPEESKVIDELIDGQVKIIVKSMEEENGKKILGYIGEIILSFTIFAIMYIIFMRVIGGMGGKGGGINQFTQSQAKVQELPETGVTFADVAGCEEAKVEVMEIVDFLKSPERYAQLGAKIPRGCLLVGSPGTGKTLLAKAIAGEAKVPFFSCSASEFVELFVGVGASRVRDMFKKAKEKAPCIIFIDEIDAIGKSRGNNQMLGGGNDEREQTINQLLTEMDGFDGCSGVIILAATNRPEILDEALLRPGRFDRRVTVSIPDLNGRKDILKIHCKNKPLDSKVDLVSVAKITAGFSGADLENLCNEAAINAARKKETIITLYDFEYALEKIILGPERKTAVITPDKRRVVAYHEAGHALVALKIGSEEKLRKVTIVPRGKAGGVTYFEPSMENIDSGLYTKKYLENKIMVALGGRASEELMFGSQNITTGASGDFQAATSIAHKMVAEFGFCEDLGPSAWTNTMAMSQEIASKIDNKVITILKTSYTKTLNLLRNNEKDLHKLAKALLEKETLSAEEVETLFNNPSQKIMV